ncbi:MAG TPA: 50S ribosomal protein L11 methyltransferase [Balneolaceae bacterium]|nr:50S ribosomal protein L11 methyltransferase [Balneolaceae bacterium]
MSYIKLTIYVSAPYQEMLIAELLDMDFYGFEQFDDRIEAYIDKKRFDDVNREQIEQILSLHPEAPDFEIEEIEERNWNSDWEKGIQPLEVGPFFIRPTWSNKEPGKDQILIEIDPKMSFGTGYHETTRLMLKKLANLDLTGKKVLDAGTGTGVLGIAALKLGAASVFAFDIDPWSIRNASENALINSVSDKFEIREGGAEVIPETEFDLAAANINRNEIIRILPVLEKAVAENGHILLSGLLKTDKDMVLKKIKELKLKYINEVSENEWILIQLRKPGKSY